MGGYDEGYRAGMQKMSDKALREAIRRSVAHAEPKKDLIDRIEGLVATCEELEEKLLSATMDGYDMAKYEYRDRIEELEAKLAECEARLEKAVELAFDECPFRDGTGSYGDWWRYRRKELEVLKGQNDE